MSSVATNSSSDALKERIIIFLDIDCYEVQLWINKLHPHLKGQDVPIVVINQDGVILSVNYTAKSLGVKRADGLRNARAQCDQHGKNLIDINAGQRYGKVDTFLRLTESDCILSVLQEFQRELGHNSLSMIIERSSLDEFYLDVTELVKRNLETRGMSWYGSGHQLLFSKEDVSRLATATKSNPCLKYRGKPVTVMETTNIAISGNQLAYKINEDYSFRNRNEFFTELCLVKAAMIAQTVIERIKSGTAYNYQASAGIGHSKLVAKLACSKNKPEGITIITNASCQRLMSEIEFQTLPGYGSTTGVKLRDYYERGWGMDVSTLSDLLAVSNHGKDLASVLKYLQVADPEAEARRLYLMCFLMDDTAVKPIVHRDNFSTSMSFINCKPWVNSNFGKKIRDLAADMVERIEYSKSNGRTPTELVVKAEMARKSSNSPCDKKNKMEFGKDKVSVKRVYRLIRVYYFANNLQFCDISKIHLTAKGIVVPKEGPAMTHQSLM